ncbi:hypothetical protein FQR65_LT02417 [Abscondita terminalis]|nr:hypothetical protein FQR65_LT02417 [Abscondita terminalis]
MSKSDYMENCDLKSTGSKLESIVQLLKSGTFYLLLKKYSKSISFFEKARDLYYEGSNLEGYISQDVDVCIIDYALVKCYSSHKKYIHKRKELLTVVEERGRSFPALFYEQALLMFDLHRFEEAKNIIDNTLQLVSDTNKFKLHYWPFSNHQIPECNMITLIDMLNSLKLQCQNQLDKQIKNSENLSDDSIYHSDHSSDKEHVSTLTSSYLTKQDKSLVTTDTNIISVIPKIKQTFKLDAPEFFPTNYCKGDYLRNSNTTPNMNSSKNCISDEKQNYVNKVDAYTQNDGLTHLQM